VVDHYNNEFFVPEYDNHSKVPRLNKFHVSNSISGDFDTIILTSDIARDLVGAHNK
jgi:hypothetical protein